MQEDKPQPKYVDVDWSDEDEAITDTIWDKLAQERAAQQQETEEPTD